MTQLYPNQLLILKVCFTLQAAIGRGSLERSSSAALLNGLEFLQLLEVLP